MKTEHEQLKEQAEQQYARERIAEVIAHATNLMEEMKKESKYHHRSMKLELACMGTMLVTVFANATIAHEFAFLLFIFVMFRNWAYVYPRVVRASFELDGVITTMQILGLIGKDDADGRRKRIKKIRTSWIERLWEATKKKKRAEAFA